MFFISLCLGCLICLQAVVAAAEPAQADDLPLLEPDEILPHDLHDLRPYEAYQHRQRPERERDGRQNDVPETVPGEKRERNPEEEAGHAAPR